MLYNIHNYETELNKGAEKEQAQAMYEAAKEAYDAYIKTIDEMILGKSGKVVYAGTKAAIEATK